MTRTSLIFSYQNFTPAVSSGLETQFGPARKEIKCTEHKQLTE